MFAAGLAVTLGSRRSAVALAATRVGAPTVLIVILAVIALVAVVAPAVAIAGRPVVAIRAVAGGLIASVGVISSTFAAFVVRVAVGAAVGSAFYLEHFLGRRDHVPVVKESIFFHADINECSLERGFEVTNPALVDGADDPLFTPVLDLIFVEASLRRDSDTRLQLFAVDYDLFHVSQCLSSLCAESGIR